MTAAAEGRPLKVALLSFAHVHAEGYAGLLAGRPGVELLTADPDAAGAPPGELRGRAFADRIGVAYADTYDEALAWGPDAVIVCSENARHRDLVISAAAAGAHVLCEKPLATSVADAEAMIAACEAADVFLMTAYPVRFSREFASLKALYDSGAIGTVLGITGTNNGKIPVGGRAWFTDPSLSGGGALADHVVHVADLIDELLGEPAVAVRAVTNQILHADKPQVRAETGGLVTITYQSGAVATIDCSWSHPDNAPNWGGLTLQVVGTEGVVEIDPFGAHVSGTSRDGASWLALGEDLDRAMLDRFLGAVRDGRPPQPDGATGLRTLRIVTAAQRSVADGRVVRLTAG
ncbi:Gfo/Idh/MocA family protein [Streptosporangium sp. NBC_01756]|uniref:Gfo/Idh/MocA family protein n=1 Tax=Streptosporangium sp. NBC_01756 TaxID=2975950 RepID=UPI002DD91777|nr:Gfo/Idh/MocA family oxidoreductase [Streptosporangium sp. NBC_01756]WSC90349.1 Gfo/Idh/MocA family oxidoreductase [Streptosporangium sp. NBC_01756]